MNLGDFGVIEREVAASTGDAATQPEPDTFTFFGTSIRIRNEINPYGLMKFAALATGQFATTELALMGLMVKTLQTWIDPADWPTFEELADKHRADAELLGRLVGTLYQELIGRPTNRSSDSADGRPTDATGEPSSEKPSPDSTASNSPADTQPQASSGTTAEPQPVAATG